MSDAPLTQSLRGKFLLASRELLEPTFAHTVILVVQHDEDGALGLVLNRPTMTSVREACEEEVEPECAVDDVLYQGGPCEGPLMVLHSDPTRSQIRVSDDVFFTADRDHIEELLRLPPEESRYFISYSGWTGGQLERELSEGAWLVGDSSRETVFAVPDSSLWKRLTSVVHLSRWVDPKQIPDDPSLN